MVVDVFVDDLIRHVRQDLIAIFGDPHDMVPMVVDRVASSPILCHALMLASIRPPVKLRVYPPERWRFEPSKGLSMRYTI
jgi:hypothetical protein